MNKHSIGIQNLKCAGCAQTILKALSKISGIKNVSVDYGSSAVSYSFEGDDVKEKVRFTLAKIGYPQTGDPNKLFTKTKSYISCAVGKITK